MMVLLQAGQPKPERQTIQGTGIRFSYYKSLNSTCIKQY
jgi:hypothetical protein